MFKNHSPKRNFYKLTRIQKYRYKNLKVDHNEIKICWIHEDVSHTGRYLWMCGLYRKFSVWLTNIVLGLKYHVIYLQIYPQVFVTGVTHNTFEMHSSNISKSRHTILYYYIGILPYWHIWFANSCIPIRNSNPVVPKL